MELLLNSVLFAFALLVGMLVCMEIGVRLRAREVRREESKDTGVVEAAIFALLGLLIAFTFSGAADRFDKRRALIVDEANAIGTAYLRLSLLASPAREKMRAQFRRYLDERLAAYRALPDLDAAFKHLAAANVVQQEIWDQSVSATEGNQSARMLLLPAINEMFDIASTRTTAARSHPPNVIFGLLFGLALVSALLAGRAMATDGKRPLLHAVLYSFAMAGAVFVILDMEFPRFGFIRLDRFDYVLVDVRNSMNP
jgi:hypothetical protein